MKVHKGEVKSMSVGVFNNVAGSVFVKSSSMKTETGKVYFFPSTTIVTCSLFNLASGLRLPLEHISLMKVHKGEVKSMSVGVFNNAGKSVAVSFTDLPAYIKMAIEPQPIPDKGKATIKAAYNTAMNGEYGLNKEQVTMVVEGKKYTLPRKPAHKDNHRALSGLSPRLYL